MFFKLFFSKTVDELKFPNILNYKLDNTYDPRKEALKYFENHPSIKGLVKPTQHFIQRNKNAMLDEMLDRFNRMEKQQNKEKIMLHEEKSC